jgi:hypothetical protein
MGPDVYTGLFFSRPPSSFDHIHDTKNIQLANVLKCTVFDPVTYNLSTAGIGRTHAGFKNERIPTDAIVVIDKVGEKYEKLVQGCAGVRSVVAYAWICVGFDRVSRQQSVKSIRQEKKS